MWLCGDGELVVCGGLAPVCRPGAAAAPAVIACIAGNVALMVVAARQRGNSVLAGACELFFYFRIGSQNFTVSKDAFLGLVDLTHRS